MADGHGGADPGRRTSVVAIAGIVLLVGACALLVVMYEMADAVRDAAARKEEARLVALRERAGASDAGSQATFEAQITEAAEARLAALPEAAREELERLRDKVDARTFVHAADAAVRLEMANRCVKACFAGDVWAAQTDGTTRLRERLVEPDLITICTLLGPMLSRSRDGGTTEHGSETTARTTFRGTFERGSADVQVSFVYAGRAQWKIDDIVVVPGERSRDEPRPDGSTTVSADHATGADGIARQTCDECRAVRFGRPGEAWQIVAARPGHVHLWTKGASRGLRDDVADGTIVLLRKGRALAAVTLRKQTETPEDMSFDWAWRDDGGTVLDPADRAVATGKSARVTAIDLRGMHVEWSVAQVGTGWLYYPRAPGEAVLPGDVRLCVTDRLDLTGLDAADPRWVFRASLSDEGGEAK